jgi:hypothetical protein
VIETVVGVFVGSLLTYVVQWQGRREDKSLQARLVLTETFRHLFGDTEWSILQGQLHRLRIYLDDAGVAEETIDRLEERALACWRDSVAQAEDHFDPEMGHVVKMSLLDDYRDTEKVVHQALKRRWWRR